MDKCSATNVTNIFFLYFTSFVVFEQTLI